MSNYKIFRRSPSLNWILIRFKNNPNLQAWYECPPDFDIETIKIADFLKLKVKTLKQGKDIFVS